MPADLATVIPLSAVSMAAGYLVPLISNIWTGKSDRVKAQMNRDVEMTKHTDELMLDVVGIAQAQIESLKQRIAELQPMEQAFYHLQQALEILVQLRAAAPEEREMAERSADAFIRRMKRMEDARGVAKNDEQVRRSTESMAKRRARGVRDDEAEPE